MEALYAWHASSKIRQCLSRLSHPSVTHSDLGSFSQISTPRSKLGPAPLAGSVIVYMTAGEGEVLAGS
jgi:hypothetical protein